MDSSVNNRRPSKRKRLTFDEKVKLLATLEDPQRGFGIQGVADLYGVGYRTVCRVHKDRDKIRSAVEKGEGHRSNHGVRRTKPVLEQHLLEFAQRVEQNYKHLCLTRRALCAEAWRIRQILVAHPDLTSPTEHRELLSWRKPPKPKWAQRFARHHSLVLRGTGWSVKLDDAKLQADVEKIKDKLAEYDLSHIYNVGEFGLFYNALPRRSFCAREESRKSVQRTQTECKTKNRLTGYACANANGTHVVPLGIIGKAKRPRAFVDASVGASNDTRPWRGLPLPYFAQKQAWSDSCVMKQWFTTVFLPHVRTNHPEEPVLLLVDSCACHAADISDIFDDVQRQVEIVPLPPYTTSKLQPMDAGIIASLKRTYRFLLLNDLVKAVEERQQRRRVGRESARASKCLAAGQLPNMLDALKLMKRSVDELRRATIVTGFRECPIWSERQMQELIALERQVRDTARTTAAGREVSSDALDTTKVLARLASLRITNAPVGHDIEEDAIAALQHAQAILAEAGSPHMHMSAWMSCDARRSLHDIVVAELGLQVERGIVTDDDCGDTNADADEGGNNSDTIGQRDPLAARVVSARERTSAAAAAVCESRQVRKEDYLSAVALLEAFAQVGNPSDALRRQIAAVREEIVHHTVARARAEQESTVAGAGASRALPAAGMRGTHGSTVAIEWRKQMATAASAPMNPGRQVFVLHYQYSTVTLQQQTMVHHTRILGRAVGGGQTIARGPSNALCVKLLLLKSSIFT